MVDGTRSARSRGENTLLWSLLLSAPGPLVTGFAALNSRSTTQLADFLRRTTELIAIFVSWRVYRVLGRTQKPKLERLANLWVGGAMFLSGVVMLCIAVFNASLRSSLDWPTGSPSPQYQGNVIPGLTIAVLGLLTNTWFWIRYRAMNRERPDSVIGAQSSLYRAKSLVDLCVVAALGAVAAAPLHPATGYVDTVGSAIVSLFLIWNGLSVVRKSRR